MTRSRAVWGLALGAGAALLVSILVFDSSAAGRLAAQEEARASGSETKSQPGAWKKGDFRKPSDEALQQRLDRRQYEVTQHEGTEPPFRNAYWDNKEAGIYVDIVSGEPLFSSLDKYKSGTGWPSFTRPLATENIVTKTDTKLFRPRVEVRSKQADSHLGHVFDDGPPPTGLRYCMNSAAMRFVPADKLAEEGYEEFVALFDLGSEK